MIAACTSVAQPDRPALLVDPTAEARAELVRVVSGVLNVETVVLADDALTRDSGLVIDRAPARDASGRRLTGRDYGTPEQFRLVTDGRQCALIHLRTNQRHPLSKVRCKAV